MREGLGAAIAVRTSVEQEPAPPFERLALAVCRQSREPCTCQRQCRWNGRRATAQETEERCACARGAKRLRRPRAQF